MDFWFDKRNEKKTLAIVSAFFVYPLLISIVVVATYSYLLSPEEKINRYVSNMSHAILMLTTFFYTIIVKTYLFLRQNIEMEE